MEKLLTVPEVSEILKVKPATIYTWVRVGKLPHLRLGRLIRFTVECLEKFTKSNGDGGSSEGGHYAGKT